MDNWSQGTFTLFVSRLYRRAIGVPDVEEVALSLFPSFPSLKGSEIQVIGFHVPVEVMEVYVGQ